MKFRAQGAIIVIDDALLDAAMKAGPFSTKKDAVAAASVVAEPRKAHTAARTTPGRKK